MTTTDVTSFDIQGRTLTLPVHVRDADSWAAAFLVSAKAAQKIVDPTGLAVAEPIPGRAMLNIAFVNYRDTDLDSYNELAVAFLVREHDAAPAGPLGRTREFATGGGGIYIHQLPVTQGFTLEAGQRIWGYPKFLADIDITAEAGRVCCSMSHEGQHVLTLTLREHGPLKLPRPALPTYSLRQGTLRRCAWDQAGDVRARLGGSTIVLGPHPLADELRALGLPKRALMSTTMRGMSATFGEATVV